MKTYKEPKIKWSEDLMKSYTKWLDKNFYLHGDGYGRDEMIQKYLNDTKDQIINAYEH